MVTRRKYRGPPAFRDGGAVPTDDVIVVASPEPAASPPEHATMPPDHPMPDDRGPLGRALDAQERAEQLQREYQARQASPIDQQIDALPGLSDHKKQFLRANPDLLRHDVAPIMSEVYRAALRAGIPDDTPDMNKAVMDGIVHQMEQRRELTSASARPTPENRAIHDHVADLDRESEQYQAEWQAEHAAPPPAALAPRRSIPYSAPVSRGVPSMSGLPRQSNNTLSPDEVRIAHNSFSADFPGTAKMSNRDKELLYLKNREKYRAMKASGEYSDQGDG